MKRNIICLTSMCCYFTETDKPQISIFCCVKKTEDQGTRDLEEGIPTEGTWRPLRQELNLEPTTLELETKKEGTQKKLTLEPETMDQGIQRERTQEEGIRELEPKEPVTKKGEIQIKITPEPRNQDTGAKKEITTKDQGTQKECTQDQWTQKELTFDQETQTTGLELQVGFGEGPLKMVTKELIQLLEIMENK